MALSIYVFIHLFLTLSLAHSLCRSTSLSRSFARPLSHTLYLAHSLSCHLPPPPLSLALASDPHSPTTSHLTLIVRLVLRPTSSPLYRHPPIQISTYALIHIHTYTLAHVQRHTYTCTHKRIELISIYPCTHTHTHTHTHRQASSSVPGPRAVDVMVIAMHTAGMRRLVASYLPSWPLCRFPASLTGVAGNAFVGCARLREVLLPESARLCKYSSRPSFHSSTKVSRYSIDQFNKLHIHHAK